MVQVCIKCGSKVLAGFCFKCDFAELEHGFLVGRYLASKFASSMDRIGDVLEEGSKDYERLCESEMKVFGKKTYETFKEFMRDSIRSGKYPELQEERFL